MLTLDQLCFRIPNGDSVKKWGPNPTRDAAIPKTQMFRFALRTLYIRLLFIFKNSKFLNKVLDIIIVRSQTIKYTSGFAIAVIETRRGLWPHITIEKQFFDIP